MICGVEWTSTVTAVPGSPAMALTVTWVPATGLVVVASIWAMNCEPSVEAKVLAFGASGVGMIVDAGGGVPDGRVVVVTEVVGVVGDGSVVVVVDGPVFGIVVVVVVVVGTGGGGGGGGFATVTVDEMLVG